jgi:predicted nucleic-acid-binding protein
MVTSSYESYPIGKTLEVLHESSPFFRPSLFIVDKCDAEIRAIKDFYTEKGMYQDSIGDSNSGKVTIRICFFHIVQAWSR